MVLKYLKQKLTELQGERGKFTITLGATDTTGLGIGRLNK
jgi:hypothetical protein